MPGPILVSDHYILRKLCDEVLIWMIGSRSVRRQWLVRLAIVYRYGGDLAAALAGLGFGGQLARLFALKPPDNANASAALHDALSGSWFWFGVGALIAWVFLRLYAQNENIVARALLAQEHVQSMRALYAELWTALHDSAPMLRIIAIQRIVDTKVQDAIRTGIWPWNPPPPPIEAISVALKVEVDRIGATWMDRWDPPSPGAI
jgi:hypothetical protein